MKTKANPRPQTQTSRNHGFGVMCFVAFCNSDELLLFSCQCRGVYTARLILETVCLLSFVQHSPTRRILIILTIQLATACCLCTQELFCDRQGWPTARAQARRRFGGLVCVRRGTRSQHAAATCNCSTHNMSCIAVTVLYTAVSCLWAQTRANAVARCSHLCSRAFLGRAIARCRRLRAS